MPYIECGGCGHKGNTANGNCPGCGDAIDHGQRKVIAEVVHITCGCGFNEPARNTNLCPQCGSVGIEKFPINTPPAISAAKEKVLH